MLPFEEKWLNTLADMESFTDSDDALSLLIHETIGESYECELDEFDLTEVAAARQIPKLLKRPDQT